MWSIPVAVDHPRSEGEYRLCEVYDLSAQLTANDSHAAASPGISSVRCSRCGPGLGSFELRACPLDHLHQNFPGLTLIPYLPQERDAAATHALTSF
jgi:hypothetical protein